LIDFSGKFAFSRSSGTFVAVTDQRISYDDLFPAAEVGARKILRITQDKRWRLVYAASDVAVVNPVVGNLITALQKRDQEDKIALTAEQVYSAALRSHFATKHLTQLGYSTVEDFRKNGLQELGKETYDELIAKLYRYDLGLELIIFGHSAEKRHPVLFAIDNPGRYTDMTWQRYAVVGSGSPMALASLRHKPLPDKLEDLTYRVLEAKFNCETASHVGSTTTLIMIRGDGAKGEMSETEIESVRKEWRRTQAQPPPAEAVETIKASTVFRAVT
jgi:hypothetical protein